jgi:hypothetical protein
MVAGAVIALPFSSVASAKDEISFLKLRQLFGFD